MPQDIEIMLPSVLCWVLYIKFCLVRQVYDDAVRGRRVVLAH